MPPVVLRETIYLVAFIKSMPNSSQPTRQSECSLLLYVTSIVTYHCLHASFVCVLKLACEEQLNLIAHL